MSRQAMEKKTSEELLIIYAEQNENDWTEEAFEAIRLVLEARGESIPLTLPKPDISCKSKVKTAGSSTITINLPLIFIILAIAVPILTAVIASQIYQPGIYLVGHDYIVNDPGFYSLYFDWGIFYGYSPSYFNYLFRPLLGYDVANYIVRFVDITKQTPFIITVELFVIAWILPDKKIKIESETKEETLVNTSKNTPKSETGQKPQVINCSNCGKFILRDSVSCPHCKVLLTDAKQTINKDKTTPNSKTPLEVNFKEEISISHGRKGVAMVLLALVGLWIAVVGYRVLNAILLHYNSYEMSKVLDIGRPSGPSIVGFISLIAYFFVRPKK